MQIKQLMRDCENVESASELLEFQDYVLPVKVMGSKVVQWPWVDQVWSLHVLGFGQLAVLSVNGCPVSTLFLKEKNCDLEAVIIVGNRTS